MNDTARGPLAEIIMQQLLERHGHTDIRVEARGLVVLFPEPCNPKVVAVLRSQGLILGNRSSKELTEADLTDDTLVLAVGIKEKEQLLSQYEPKHLYTIREFAGDTGEITDPYGRDMEAYVTCAKELHHWLTFVEERLYS